MDRMLYVAMTGARETLLAQAMTANNLANVATAGFRRDVVAFRSLPAFDSGLPSRVYGLTERAGVDLNPGRVVHTGRDLDVTVDGDGWMVVLDSIGNEALLRSAELQVSAQGLLRTADGALVLGDGGPITVPAAEKIEIGVDGTVSVRPAGEAATESVAVGRIRLIRPGAEQVEKDLTGRMRLRAGEVASPDASVRLRAGAVEASNVSTVDALVEMIDLARRFEMQVKMMSVADDTAQASDRLLRTS